MLASTKGADIALVRDYLHRSRAERSPELVAKIWALLDDYGSITLPSGFAEGILLVAEGCFEQAFGGALRGLDLGFSHPLWPYVWARWR